MAELTSKKSEKEKSAEQAQERSPELPLGPVLSGPYANVMSLQRSAGNQAVNQLLQPDAKGIPSIVQDVLNSGGGQPLDPTMCEFMGSRLGHNFDGVRVHTDTEAAESAHAVNAAAYTAGQDVVFGAGQYQPGTERGRQLLAHELLHVVQQQAGANLQNGVNDTDTPYERQADVVAEQLTGNFNKDPMTVCNRNLGASIDPVAQDKVSIQRSILGIERDMIAAKRRKPPLDESRNPEDPCCYLGAHMRSAKQAKAEFGAKRAKDLVNVDLRITGKKEDGKDGPINEVQGILSASVIPDLEDLLRAASSDDAHVGCVDTSESDFTRMFRNLNGQWLAFHKKTDEWHEIKPKAPVALPGRSNHGTGRAIDFYGDLDWLLKNGGKYGWVNLPAERWHYDHVDVSKAFKPKTITKKTRRSWLYESPTSRLYRTSQGRKKEIEAFGEHYKDAQVFVALVWNRKQNYATERWLEVQEYVGMPVEDRTGTVDEETVKAVMAWQESYGIRPDGKVGFQIDMFQALGGKKSTHSTGKKKNNVRVKSDLKKKSGSSAKNTRKKNRKRIQRKPLKSPSSIKAVDREIPRQVGWSGTITKNRRRRPIKSINSQISNQEGIWRIPLEGLEAARATEPEDPQQKGKYVFGRAIVLVPENVRGTKGEDVEVLIHLHGHTAGYKTAVEKTPYGAHPGQTEDLDNDRIVQQLKTSGRKMIVILPQGELRQETIKVKDAKSKTKAKTATWVDFAPEGNEFDSNKLIKEVLPRLWPLKELAWEDIPNISRTVLSGFSGGGNKVVPMLESEDSLPTVALTDPLHEDKERPGPIPRLGELILFDALHGDKAKTVRNFLEKQLDKELEAITKLVNKGTEIELIRKYGFRFRGITTGRYGYGPRYQLIQDFLYSGSEGWFPRHAAELGGKDSPIYRALSANYQIIFSKNPEHGTLMGTSDPKHRTAQGHLEEALRAGPTQE